MSLVFICVKCNMSRRSKGVISGLFLDTPHQLPAVLSPQSCQVATNRQSPVSFVLSSGKRLTIVASYLLLLHESGIRIGGYVKIIQPTSGNCQYIHTGVCAVKAKESKQNQLT